jgi:hypothetical protein
MAGDDHDPDVARSRLLELLEADEWELSESARLEGKVALRWLHNREPTDCDMVDHVIALLKTLTIRCAPQGNPPGSTGIAWQMTDAMNVFVKLRICERRIGQEYAFVQSIHESIHQK